MADTVLLGVPAIELAHRTDPGRDPEKQINEDAVGCRETIFGHLCVVCDGMGGHKGGRDASNLALKTIFEVFEEAATRGPQSGRDLLREAVSLANRRVFGLAAESAVGRPGSTVVAILLHAAGTEVAHVGDSRCYRVHQGQIAQVTRDHSMVQQLVDAHVLTPEQAATHPDANKITRALGMTSEVDVEVRLTPVPHVAGDVFVLCTDGLSDLVGAPDIVKIAATAPAAQAAGQLVDLANARGGHDNVTVVVARARESATPSREAAKTEAMAARTVVDAPSGGHPRADGAVLSSRAPPSERPADSRRDAGWGPARIPPAASYHATDPPIGHARGRRVSLSAVFAVVLGLVGLAVGGAALWFVLPHPKKTPAAPFSLDASAPAASTAAPAPPAPAISEAPVPEPLPSLVPSPPTPSPQRHLSRRPAPPPVYP